MSARKERYQGPERTGSGKQAWAGGSGGCPGEHSSYNSSRPPTRGGHSTEWGSHQLSGLSSVPFCRTEPKAQQAKATGDSAQVRRGRDRAQDSLQASPDQPQACPEPADLLPGQLRLQGFCGQALKVTLLAESTKNIYE